MYNFEAKYMLLLALQRSHNDKLTRDEQLLSNLRFEIDELVEEVDAEQMNLDKEETAVGDLQSRRVDGELQLSKLEAEVGQLRERLEQVRKDKQEQQRALDEQAVKLKEIDEEKAKLLDWFESAKEERAHMRESFAENLRATREGLASQRAKVQEQKQVKEQIQEERLTMKAELDEVHVLMACTMY